MQLLFIVPSPRVTAEWSDEGVDPWAVWDKVFLVDDDSFIVRCPVDNLVWIFLLLHLFFFHWGGGGNNMWFSYQLLGWGDTE